MRVALTGLLVAACLCVATGCRRHPQARAGARAMEPREEPAMGIRLRVPAGWHRKDMTAGAKVVVFSPTETDLTTRISLVQAPAAAMPAGLETREAGIEKVLGARYHRVRLEAATVAGRPGSVLEYTTDAPSPTRVIEYGVRTGSQYDIVQVAAPPDRWPSLAADFEAVRASVALFEPPRPPNETSTMVAMRDGARLYTYVVLPPRSPAAAARVPALLIRSPYYDQYFELTLDSFRPLTKQGFALVYQSVRGTGKSEGQLRPMSQEFADGQDAVRWIVKQPWSNGAVATFGSSYDGFTALAAAVDTPEVKLVLADGAPARAFETWPATDGGAVQAQLLWWDRAVKGLGGDQSDPAYRRTITNSRPVRDLDVAAFGAVDPVWRGTLHAMDRDSSYWNDWSLTPDKLARICAPVISMQAKNEYTSDGLDTFLALTGHACNASVRAADRYVLHAGDHGEGIYHPLAATPLGNLIQSYLKKYLEGEPVTPEPAPVLYFIQNANAWRTSDRWPASDRTTTFYLDARGAKLVDSPKGHPAHVGQLVPAAPGAEGSVGYTFDPAVDDACDPAVFTERLAFEGPKLAAPLDTVGRAELVLFVKIDTPDTDLFVNLVDEAAAGERPVGQGVGMRLRFRHSMTNPEPMRPGEIAELHLQLNSVAYRFAAGSSILVTVRSTTCGESENPNTGGSMTEETRTRPVHVQVLTGPAHPSRLILPTL